MTPSETAELLSIIQMFDRRTVGENDILAWHQILKDVELSPAAEAVTEHFGISKEWLMPVDIKNLIAAKSRRRIGDIPPVDPPWQLADDPARERRWVSEYRHAIADGLPQETAIGKANWMLGITDEPEPLAIEAAEVDRRISELRRSLTASRERPVSDPARRTPAMWAADRGLMILDPDGWRSAGKDPRLPCTEEEFDELLPTCTVGPFERRTEPLEMPPVGIGADATEDDMDDDRRRAEGEIA